MIITVDCTPFWRRNACKINWRIFFSNPTAVKEQLQKLKETFGIRYFTNSGNFILVSCDSMSLILQGVQFFFALEMLECVV